MAKPRKSDKIKITVLEIMNKSKLLAVRHSDGNIGDKYRYISIFLYMESIDMKTKMSINIEKRNAMEK